MDDAAGLSIMVFEAVGAGAHPYLGSFYGGLRRRGVRVVQGHFAGRWLLSNLRGVDVLHLHWPSFHYHSRSRALTLYRAALLCFVLVLARMRGIGVVWTVHNLMPHEACVVPGLDRAMRWAVIAAARRFLVHGAAAEAAAVRRFPAMAGRTVRIGFGHWVGLYPDEITREAARVRLGLGEGEWVCLFLGQVRAYKNVEALVGCMRGLPERAVLVVAGAFVGEGLEARVRAAAEGLGRRVRIFAGHVRDEEMQVYLRACDVVVAPYAEVLTSATVVLAGAFGRGFIGPRMGFLIDAVPDECGILYDPGDGAGLGMALAAGMEARFDERAIVAHSMAVDWDGVAGQVVEDLRVL